MSSEVSYVRITKPIMVKEVTLASNVLERMKRENKSIALVMGEKGVIGSLSRERIERALSTGHDVPVREIMSTNILTVTGNEDCLDLLSLIVKNKLDCVVVMRGKKVDGVITLHDVLYTIQKRALT
ncbi:MULTISPECIES: CBS domain-containing protein [Metallosphaera]|uniref:CBS domain-containing protein n=3 Tax=Metallosphaera TaxID=41980 RepID=A0A4D8S0T8_METPR|nr:MULTISPECIES: CBS domain-containing protein [Metallosphaera]ABP95140.1 putative signal-transduction protein with CBS domains [Metallosphaera sedula DSM 5348]AIM27126.1 putative signal-transduction protein with CBS domains [Metallosphaera sedula]AKV74033.1 hypothetical protein MsedA_0985 [Metallosphaera sedula]AKV76272.1 hypothetical protein MsedB_0986 [Metallosphaera sedula]AKV78524.1 hypothetical protein MsedC_0985 [Metallosphaera sedula]